MRNCYRQGAGPLVVLVVAGGAMGSGTAHATEAAANPTPGLVSAIETRFLTPLRSPPAAVKLLEAAKVLG